MKRSYFVNLLGSSIGLILALLLVGVTGSASADNLAQSAVGLQAAQSGGNAPESVPLSSTFTYQGRLANNGAPVTGTCGLAFRLFDDSSAGNLVGSPITLTAVSVVDGYFSVGLNFGSSAFTGS